MRERSVITGSRRFRRRLTAAFVLVAAVSAGVVAAVTFVLARQYRWDAFRSNASDEARFALAVAPTQLEPSSFERFRDFYDTRSDADILVVDGSTVYSSSTNLDASAIPASLELPDGAPHLGETTTDGREMLVAGVRDDNGATYYLFFPLEQLRDSLDELGRAALLSWLVTLLIAAAVGRFIARRTLRPVAAAASAATAIAAGDLTARLPAHGNDEFGTMATSFNNMADEVQELIGQLSEAAERERRFTADVAHELRTPLTGLAASAALLRDQLAELPDRAQGPAEIIVADVERLRDLTLELLEMARLDAASDPPHIVPLRVGSAVDAVVAAAVARRSADINVDVGANLMVLAEPVALRRILSNLIDNAIVHGRGAVHVAARRSNGHVRVDVTDDGPGISSDELGKVFDRFHKSDHSRTVGGSGLGLAIALQYATRLRGSLTAGNEVDRGARFTLELPAAGELIEGVTEP